MLVVLLFTVPGAESVAFQDEVGTALEALAAGPGYRGGRLGRSVDDPSTWTLVLEWSGVGDYRRTLSSYDAKVAAAPLLARAYQVPSAFEVLRADGPQGATFFPSDRSETENG